ncbi:MAG TPA: hypothetical protein VIP52_13835 [Candidatus Dormibacteraeota bacterium]|jgi:hypothetical protein
MRRLLVGLVVAILASACELPLGLGLPTTRELENGAITTLTSARSLEVAGSYQESSGRWDFDVQIARPASTHIVASRDGVPLEAILIGKDGYFRGRELLALQLNGDEASRSLATAAGNGWWKGLLPSPPDLSDFTDAAKVKATFINPSLDTRRDHLVDRGVRAVMLSGPRADVFIREAAPHDLLRLRMHAGTTVAGISRADLLYSHYGTDFKIVPPADVINFADLSTLPPIYTVLSVDASGCASPCLVQAALKNLGGRTGAKAPSTITFEMTNLVSGGVIGSCTATVAPDVDYNATTTVSCSIASATGVDFGAARVTATPNNPGHA